MKDKINDKPLEIVGFSRVFVMCEIMEKMNMSREMTLVERMGIEFEERDGLLEEKAVAVNQEAYELLCGMEKKLLEESN